MNRIFKRLYSTSQTREIERHIFEDLDVEEFDLMFNAGKFAFEILQSHVANKNYKIKILCGPGNNGGDGFILGAFCQELGYDVEIFEIGDFLRQSNTAFEARNMALKCGVKVSEYYDSLRFEESDVIIDAILGIGLTGQVRAKQQEVIEKINDSNCFVLSIDCPSGLNCDNGDIMGACVRSDVCVTFLSLKQGQFLKYGSKYCGEIFFSDLEVNYANFLDLLQVQYLTINDQDILKLIPPRELESHKGSFGDVLVVGGDYGMAGAVLMASEASCRSGAGKVSVLTRKEHIEALNIRLPNVMSVIFESYHDLEISITNKDFLVIGPGLGKGKWSRDLFEFFMSSNLPKLIDADALNLLAKSEKFFDLSNAIITPHPKEAAKLLDISVSQVQENRKLAAQKLHEKYGCIVVLKGANSLIYDGDDFILCPYSNPGMAVGGMGDILSGLIAGFAMQNISLEAAALVGTFIHAISANLLVEEYGEIGLLPLEVVENLPFAYSYLRNQLKD